MAVLGLRCSMKNHVVYFIKRPNPKEKRVTFSILAKHTPPLNGKKHTQVEDERLDALNQALKSGVPIENVEVEIKNICDALNVEQKKKENGIWIASADNLRLVEEYWEREVSDRKNRRPYTAKRRLFWAVEMIGPTPLLGDRRELQKVLDQRSGGNKRRQRKLCAVLNEIRKWHGITQDRLKPEKKSRPKFLFLEEEEFKKVLPYIEAGPKQEVSDLTLQSLMATVFYSGVRPGEAFAFKADHYSNGELKVLTQIDRFEEEIDTKNGKVRTTLLFKEGEEHFFNWINATDKDKLERTGLARLLKKACKKSFPNQPDKWVSVKDLRHSYAVMCIKKKGFSISEISILLGNTVTVCEEYYLNFVLQNSDIQSLKMRAAVFEDVLVKAKIAKR
jgi:integrase